MRAVRNAYTLFYGTIGLVSCLSCALPFSEPAQTRGQARMRTYDVPCTLLRSMYISPPQKIKIKVIISAVGFDFQSLKRRRQHMVNKRLAFLGA